MCLITNFLYQTSSNWQIFYFKLNNLLYLPFLSPIEVCFKSFSELITSVKFCQDTFARKVIFFFFKKVSWRTRKVAQVSKKSSTFFSKRCAGNCHRELRFDKNLMLRKIWKRIRYIGWPGTIEAIPMKTRTSGSDITWSISQSFH